jgi:hypothetical protein
VGNGAERACSIVNADFDVLAADEDAEDFWAWMIVGNASENRIKDMVDLAESWNFIGVILRKMATGWYAEFVAVANGVDGVA